MLKKCHGHKETFHQDLSFPSTDTLAQTTVSSWKPWSGELVFQHENPIKTASVRSTVPLCILTWHGVALPHSPRTNLLTPCRAVSMQVLSYSSNSCSLDFKASKSRVKGETISYNEEKAICNRRIHSDVSQLLWYYINKLNPRYSAHSLVTDSLSYPNSYLFCLATTLHKVLKIICFTVNFWYILLLVSLHYVRIVTHQRNKFKLWMYS